MAATFADMYVKAKISQTTLFQLMSLLCLFICPPMVINFDILILPTVIFLAVCVLNFNVEKETD